MAISNNYVPLFQLGNGVTTQFSGNWAMIAAAYAAVYLQDAVTGVQTPVAAGVGSNQYQLVFNNSGFTVTFGTAPTSGQYAVIGRNVSFDQTDPYRTSTGFQGEVIEASVDKLTAICQDLNDIGNRSLKFPLGSTAVGTLPTPVDDTILAWSGTAGAVKNGPTTASVSGAGASAAQAAASAAQAIAAAATAQLYGGINNVFYATYFGGF